MSNIWRKEYNEGIEIMMPHRPLLDDEGQPIVDAEGTPRFHTVRVRSLTAAHILSNGKMPNNLRATAEKVLLGMGLINGDPETSDEPSSEELGAILTSLNEYQQYVINQILVSPKIVDNPKKDDEISYEMLSADDIIFFINDVLDKPLANLRTFPAQSAPSVAIVSKCEVDGVPQDSE